MTEYVEPRGREESRTVETPVAAPASEPSRRFLVLFLVTVLSLYVLLGWTLYTTVRLVLDLV